MISFGWFIFDTDKHTFLVWCFGYRRRYKFDRNVKVKRKTWVLFGGQTKDLSFVWRVSLSMWLIWNLKRRFLPYDIYEGYLFWLCKLFWVLCAIKNYLLINLFFHSFLYFLNLYLSHDLSYFKCSIIDKSTIKSHLWYYHSNNVFFLSFLLWYQLKLS